MMAASVQDPLEDLDFDEIMDYKKYVEECTREQLEDAEAHAQSSDIDDYDDEFEFIYTPLDLKQTDGMATRLLKVLPELSSDGLVQCELIPVIIECHFDHIEDRGYENCFESTSKYDPWVNPGKDHRITRTVDAVEAVSPITEFWALSYLWGSETGLRTISVNNVPFRVRSNVFEFLNNIRDHPDFSVRWGWIDALCINQNDLMERNYQVQSMGLIYRHAHWVITWLGLDLGSQLELKNTFLDFYFQFWRSMDYDFWEQPDELPHLSTRIEEAAQRVCYDLNCWDADYQTVFSAEYWTRAWVFQELYLAHNCILYTGWRSVAMKALLRSNRLIAQARTSQDSDAEQKVPEKDELAQLLQRVGDGRAENGPLALARLLQVVGSTRQDTYLVRLFTSNANLFKQSCQALRCSDPKDHIFSQLSMTRGSEDFIVDYSEDNISLLLRTFLLCARDSRTTGVHAFLRDWHYVLRTLDVKAQDLRHIMDWIDNRQEGGRIPVDLLLDCERERIELSTYSPVIHQGEGVPDLVDGYFPGTWIHVTCECCTTRINPGCTSKKSMEVALSNTLVQFTSSSQEQAFVTVGGPPFFSRSCATTIKFNDEFIELSLADMIWAISLVCEIHNTKASKGEGAQKEDLSLPSTSANGDDAQH